MSETTAQPSLNVQVEAAAEVTADLVGYAREKVAAVVGLTAEPVLYARVRLSLAGDPAVHRRAVAQANLDWNGRMVRAQIAADTLREAVDHLQSRLRDRMEHMSRDWEALRGRRPVAEPHEWRHISEPANRADYFPRPADERQIVRHKSFSLPTATPDEAAFDMAMLDYDFHLFTETSTGQDSVIYRVPGGYRLAQLSPAPKRLPPSAVPLTVSHQPAVVSTVEQAVDRLNESGLPFVFFRNAETGRGNLLYHRYDGHYGLITPAA